ncbi:hypothetical protein KY336_02825, partial [Candidatus Woesearchaeota archaeon]|nr:hypothetical protein [Candidatus Woesearchaeota archaeon]
YKANNDLKAFAYMLMVEECKSQLKAIDRTYDARKGELKTKKLQATERSDRLASQIIDLEKEIQEKESRGENISNGLQARLSKFLEEKETVQKQVEDNFGRYDRKIRAAEREKAEERAGLLVTIRDCEAYLNSYSENPKSPDRLKVAVSRDISKFIYDTLTIEWAKRDAAEEKELFRQREIFAIEKLEKSRRRWGWFRRGCFAAGALIFAAGLYIGISYLASKPNVPKRIEETAVEASSPRVVNEIPKEEPAARGYEVVKEIGYGDELTPGRIFKGIETNKEGECQLVFEETVTHEDGSVDEQNIFSSPFRAGSKRFDGVPDCKVLRYELDYDSETQRVRVLQATLTMPRPTGMRPATGITYTPLVDVPISEMTPFSSHGPASGFRIIRDQFDFGKRYLEFFWQRGQHGLPGQRRRIGKVLHSSAINLTDKDGKFDNKPDCIVVEFIGGPRALIDIEATRTGENTYELSGIRFLEKDK